MAWMQCLCKQDNPIAYMSKALKGKTLQLSTYKKELLAVMTVVQK